MRSLLALEFENSRRGVGAFFVTVASISVASDAGAGGTGFVGPLSESPPC